MTNEYGVLIGLGIQTLLFLGGGYGMVLRNDWSNKAMEKKVEGMQAQIIKLSEVVIQMAVQTNRLDNLAENYAVLQRTVEDLRRGDGWVQQRVDGGYP